MFYKYFIQLCILTFETILLFSFNKKIEFRRNFIKEFRCFTKLEHFLPSWVLVQHINEVLDNLTSDPWETESSRCSGFFVMIWHANCSSQDATRNLHNKCIYARILNIFFFKFAQLLFSESNRFLWLIYCIDG